MNNITEKHEKEHLQNVISKIEEKLNEAKEKVNQKALEIMYEKRYLWENIYELDPMEILSNKQSISMSINSAELTVDEVRKLNKLRLSPYFGRIDFQFKDKSETFKIYIGMYSFSKKDSIERLIYDWRAPISSMFYDYEKGTAQYEAPVGIIEGEILLKRQYKIKDGKLEFYIESSLNINDELLQRELSKASSNKMRDIVTTIQKEQNQIIRNDDAYVLVIQGVAGSGKTSIALHRVAYLLYKYKETLKANNVLIISPNKIFSDYISNILPELGEERILEISFQEIAENELGNKIKFESFFTQIQNIISNRDEEYVQRISYKSTNNFLKELKSYIEYLNENIFKPISFKIQDVEITKEYLIKRFNGYSKYPVLEKIKLITSDVIEYFETNKNIRVSAKAKKDVLKKIMSMLETDDVLQIYKNFYKYIGKENMLNILSKSKLEYADVFPLVYIKIYFVGFKDFYYVKHLIIDEMQDYTPVQYEIVSNLFKCKKTILGDSNQYINPFSNNSPETIANHFEKSKLINLYKSYRSTYEIINFVQKIIFNDKLISVERHGEEPKIVKINSDVETLKQLIKCFKKSNTTSLGIICKDKYMSERIFGALSSYCELVLLSNESTELKQGVIITTAYMAKGLEFDEVIVVNADDNNYNNEIDRGLLYVACTRAMHKLTIIYQNKLTRFLE